MKRARHHLSPWQVYADQLLLLIGATLMMLMLLIPITNPPATHKKADAPKAEFLITLSWDDKRDVDLDLWLKADDCVIYYLNRECPNIALDRDSLGFTSNRKRLSDGSYAVSANREVVAIRAVMPGDYITAVSYYGGRDANGTAYHPFKSDPRSTIDATVEVERVNPAVTTVGVANLHFTRMKDTQNALAFRVDPDGMVTIQPLPPEDMISQHQRISSLKMTHDYLVIGGLLSGFALLIAWMFITSRVPAIVRIFSSAVAVIFAISIWLNATTLMGYAVPAEPHGAVSVLGILDDKEHGFIYVWVEERAGPRAYQIVYNSSLAKKLQQGKRQVDEEGGQIVLREQSAGRGNHSQSGNLEGSDVEFNGQCGA